MKTAFIGAGNHATWTLYPALQHVPEFEIEATCDLNEERAHSAARRFGIRSVFTDFRRMLDEHSFDALFCCGGPLLHSQVAAVAIERRTPVFVEKPPAPSAQAALALARLASENETAVVVGFMHRFAHATAWARKAMETPDFGRVVMCYAREGIWGTDLARVAMDSGIHHLDLLLSIAGPVRSVQARLFSNGASRHAYTVMLQFANGAIGQVGLNSLESLGTPGDIVEIHGDNGQWVRIDNWQRAMLFRDPHTFVEPPDDLAHANLTYEHSWTAAGINQSAALQGYVGELRHFAAVVRDGVLPCPDLRDGFRAMQLVEAVQDSATNDGATLTLEDPFEVTP